MATILEAIVTAVLAFFFGKAESAVAIAETEKKIDDGAKAAVQTKDTSSLEDALSD